MSTKAALKAAKSAIDAKRWDEATEQANTVLEKDAQNYFAKLFLGRAYDGLGKLDSAAQAYNDATKIKPQEPQAWLGLRGLYEKQGRTKVDERIDVELKLALIYAELDDAHKAQTAIDKLVDHARRNGTKQQYARALTTQLPTSPIYSYLEGRLPNPAATYTRIAEIHETEEAQIIKRQIDERKTRLGATLESTTIEVRNEVYGASPLEDIYQGIIDWTSDDALRREYEEKLLQRAYDTLLVLPPGKKSEKRVRVMKLAHDMVIIKHPYLLAWQIELEWRSGLEVEAY
ncbi:Superkiller protein 3 [Kalmusia sp. IMI 367209]|nr:Superkiller protein 3 [Kalmusia sp. IMI 367209]